MRVALTDQDDPMTAGFIGSIVFHILVLLAVVFGVPSFFEPEILPEPLGIEAAIVSDITAAPKVQQPSNKKPEKPKEQPAPEKQKPKAETPPPAPPPPPAAPPPPPAPEQQAVVIPDKTLKPQEKKPEEKKKPEEPKKETKKPDKPKEDKKKQDDDFSKLLGSVLKDAPAPEPAEKPKKNTVQPPAKPTSGPQTELASDVPMTSSDEDGIRQQISSNWIIDPGAQNAQDLLVELRISLQPDGTVTRVDILNNRPGDATYAYFARNARNAVLKSSPLRLPGGKYWPTIKLRFTPRDLM